MSKEKKEFQDQDFEEPIEQDESEDIELQDEDFSDDDDEAPPPIFKQRENLPRSVLDRKPTVQMIAGRQPVIEALRAGTLIEKIVILFGVKGMVIEKIRKMAKQNHVPCVEVGKQKFRDLVSDTTTQGVVAIVGTKRYVDSSDILAIASKRNEPAFIIILDEIQDPQNLGAIIRTAECAGAHGVIIPKHNAAYVNQTVVKASAGAAEHLLIAKVTNLAQTIDELKKQGVWVVGTDTGVAKQYTEMDFSMPLALVIGSEGAGMRKLTKDKCDFVVKIPVFGKVQSLNASVAGALVMYEIIRNRKLMNGKAQVAKPQRVETKQETHSTPTPLVESLPVS